MFNKSSKLVCFLAFVMFVISMTGCGYRSVWDRKYYEYQPTFNDRAVARTIASEKTKKDPDVYKDKEKREFDVNGMKVEVREGYAHFPDFKVSIPLGKITVSDADVIGFSSDLQKIFRHRMNKARRVRLGSGTLQILAASAGATVGLTSGDVAVAGGFAMLAAVIPELQNIFQARGRVAAYTDGLKLIQDAQARYYKNRVTRQEEEEEEEQQQQQQNKKMKSIETISTKELTEEESELLVQTVSCIKLVDKPILTHIPTIENLQKATGRLELTLGDKIKKVALEYNEVRKIIYSKPIAKDEIIIIPAVGPKMITVLDSVTDYSGDINPSTLKITVNPQKGVAAPQADGTILYTPNGTFNVLDSFKYTVKDYDENISNEATVTIKLNTPPVANDDTVSAPLPLSNTIDIDILSNDVDSAGSIDPKTVEVSVKATNGNTIVNVDGKIKYTNTGTPGQDTFKYKVKDDFGVISNEATVTINVNTPPVANDDPSANTSRNKAVVIKVLSNDTDADGNQTIGLATVKIKSDSTPINGVAKANLDGTILYTPNGNLIGVDVFEYTVKDTIGDQSNPAKVTVNVSEPPPTAVDDPGNITLKTQQVPINVLSNDTAHVGTLDPSSVEVTSDPNNGNVNVIIVSGTIQYTPNNDFTGVDLFKYTVKDSRGLKSNEATVIIDVQ